MGFIELFNKIIKKAEELVSKIRVVFHRKNAKQKVETKQKEEVEKVSTRARANWGKVKRAFFDKKNPKRIARSFPIDSKGEYDLDCVAIKVNKAYLGEVATGINRVGLPIENNARQLKYDPDKKQLQYQDDNVVVSTIGKKSKGERHAQAFVMDKEGRLHIFQHGYSHDGEKVHVHGAVLDEKPAEMAGVIKIDPNGKISFIGDSSGHYQPDKLDIYRGIKRLEKEMPGVFRKEFRVKIGRVVYARDRFIEGMERESSIGDVSGPLYKLMRDKRETKNSQLKSNILNKSQQERILNKSRQARSR